MPYIKAEDRPEWDEVVKQVVEKLEAKDETAKEGCLNYFMTKILKSAYKPKYFNYNRIMGLLECIKFEFYRRDIGPYEDTKIEENGDVEFERKEE